jgi:hypothetical protein
MPITLTGNPEDQTINHQEMHGSAPEYDLKTPETLNPTTQEKQVQTSDVNGESTEEVCSITEPKIVDKRKGEDVQTQGVAPDASPPHKEADIEEKEFIESIFNEGP